MSIAELHSKAMDIANEAFDRKGKGDEGSVERFREAFELEKDAALSAYHEKIGEPSVAILLRSAAALAMNAGILNQAEKLIHLALSGEPPFEIAEELNALLEDLHGQKLHIKVVENNASESPAGKAIELIGRLSAADEDKNNLRLNLQDGTKKYIMVPFGLQDIVKKYWGKTVSIKGSIVNKTTINLLNIDAA